MCDSLDLMVENENLFRKGKECLLNSTAKTAQFSVVFGILVFELPIRPIFIFSLFPESDTG